MVVRIWPVNLGFDTPGILAHFKARLIKKNKIGYSCSYLLDCICHIEVLEEETRLTSSTLRHFL